MKNNAAVTIVRAKEGFIVYQENEPNLPCRADEIMAYSELEGNSWDQRTIFGFLKNHFRNDPTQEEKTSS